MATNLELAKAMADWADGLADLNHLPPLAFGVVHRRGTVTTRPHLDVFDAGDVGVRAIAVWADAFGVPVELDLSDAVVGGVEIRTVVTIAARPTRISQGMSIKYYRAVVEPRLGIGQVESGEQVQVTAEQVLAALGEKVA